MYNAGGTFVGQHDARLLPDGTLTLHDNGTGANRAPRAVHYRLDTSARTATLLDQITDPSVSASPCCGSARLQPNGSWILDWGGTGTITGLGPGGDRSSLLQFETGKVLSYRAEPVLPGVLSRSALRAGMDAQAK